MTDLKIMVDATKQLNLTWSTCSKDIEKEDDTSEVYNAMCEIDEAIINLVEKVGLCVKAQLISTMYGTSSLVATHNSVVKRNRV